VKNINENVTSRLSKEFEIILKKFFSDEEVKSFIQKINLDILKTDNVPLSINNADNETLITESFFTSKLRLLSDRTITFANKKLEKSDYYKFLIDLGRLLIVEGENNIAAEIFNFLQKNSNDGNYQKSVKPESMLALADIYCRQGLWKEAELYIKKARLYFEKDMNSKGLGKCEHLMGTIYLEQGDLKAAKFRFENCLAYLNVENDKLIAGMVEVNFGIIKDIEGDLEAAYNYYDNSLRIFEEVGDKRRKAEVKYNMGIIYIKRKEYESALNVYDECIALSLDSQYLPILGISYLSKAIIFLETDDLPKAIQYVNRAMEVCYQINNKIAIADIYKVKGIISRKLKDLELSEDFLLTSLRLNRDLNNELNYAETAYELGLLYLNMDNKKEADLFFNESLVFYKKNNARTQIAKIQSHLSINNGNTN